MDFWNTVRELHLERERLNKLIGMLESMQVGGSRRVRSRRGRKHMPEDERKIVSERMRAYWARRRTGGAAAATA
jgi:hypothetical protein